jgi:hypothetical protein
VTEVEAIRPGEAPLTALDAQDRAISTLPASHGVEAGPIAELGDLAVQESTERVLGLEGGASASGAAALAGDFDSFLVGEGKGGGCASFFGLEARGKDFVYVVDISGSMSGEKFSAAKSELIASLSRLRRNMRFLVIFYNQGFTMMPGGRMLKASDASKRSIYTWINHFPAGGGTDPTAAMQAALRLEPDAIWLLSDGIFADAAALAIRAANPRARVQVHTVAFFDNEGEPILRRIAEANRGNYRFVSPSAIGLGTRRRALRRP